ncbi:MucBP domain-containing protein [Schleiferilactobacillus shenzhenensis]|uniref:MucBP domain-containing protein n=1 Tax=Schleiferilactobacillus shenzhenensis LY-73 TaxID=1231336 RepID=U4TXR9_9LACO|nr:MucBP domain-containing protein [Schleiferilactobacillus shenzhenensis]ERL66142.1 hypothetical protein L248_1234 [Schleiferilactobacillus shenzhenensis LY-73]
MTQVEEHGRVPARRESPLSVAPVRIVVRYLSVLGERLLADTQVTGPAHSHIDLPWRVIRGYKLVRVENYAEVFQPVPGGIRMIYMAQKAAPVVVYHKNAEGNLIVPPQYVSGDLNATYHLHPLSGNPFPIIQAPPTDAGVFGTKSKSAQYVYDTLQLMRLPVDKQLLMRMNTAVRPFADPLAREALPTALPGGSTWPVYRAVVDRFSRAQWYDLGGGIWVKRTSQMTLLGRPLPMQPPELTPFRHRAEVVNHTQNAVSLFQFPRFGQAYKTIPSGTMISTTGLMADDQGRQWVALDSQLFISRWDLLLLD